MLDVVKHIVRTLWKHKAQTLILLFLGLLPGFFYTYLDIPITSVNNASDQVRTDSQPEQFRFMVSVPGNDSAAANSSSDSGQPNAENDSTTASSPSDIHQLNAANENLQSRYGFTSELVRKKFLQQKYNEKKCNFYIKLMPQAINIPVFLTGVAPSRNGQVAVSKVFAEKNGVAVSSPIKIDSKDYVVSGIYVAPDEEVAFDPAKSPDMSPDVNARILMLEDDFQAMNKEESAYFVGRLTSEDNDVIHNKVLALAQEDTILYANMSSDYTGIGELSASVTTNTQLMFLALSAVGVILLVAILIHLTNQFISNRKPIGVWLTTGFSSKQVVLAYSIYFFVFAVAALAGMMLGFFMSYSNLEGARNYFNAALTEPSVDGLKWLIFLGATAVPLTLLVMAQVYKETKKMLISLICGSNDNQRLNVFISRIRKSTSFMKFENRAKVSTVVHRGVRFVSILLTFFIAYNLLGAGLAISSSVDRTLADYQGFLKFDRIEYYDSSMTENNDSALNAHVDVFIDENVKLIKSITKNIDIGVPVIMQGLSQSQHSIGIDSSLLADGVIISQMAAAKYNIAINDELQFMKGDTYYRYKVAGINEAAFDSKIYIDITEMYYWDTYTTGDYTGAYVTSSSRGEDVYESIRREDLINFYRDYGQSAGTVSGGMFIVSLAISLALIILTAVFNYNDAMTKVALGKSLGDSNRTVNNMFVNVFDPVAVIGCLLGMISLPFLLKWLEKILIAQSGILSDYYIFFRASLPDMGIALVALIFCYGLCKFSINLATRGRPIARALQPE